MYFLDGEEEDVEGDEWENQQMCKAVTGAQVSKYSLRLFYFVFFYVL